MALMSQREYARTRGVSHSAVQKALSTGRISGVKVGKRVKLDPDVADREWNENTDRSTPLNSVVGDPKHRREAGAAPEPMALDGRDGGNGGVPAGGGGTGYARARAAREAVLAQTAKLALDERMGLLVRREDVRIAAFNAARKARDHLIGIPERLAAVLAAIDDVDEIARVLETEIERICGELSGAGPDGN